MGTSEEELEEDVFRKRKVELTSGAGRSLCKMNGNLFLAGREIRLPWVEVRVISRPQKYSILHVPRERTTP